MKKVVKYALQEAGGFTFGDMATLTGIAEQTIRNFLTKRTEKNPGFATITKLVISLGGDLNELIGYDKKKEIEINSTVSLKETYEMRIADIIKSYETRIDDVKSLCEERIADVKMCCETRVADMKREYDERLNDYREILKHYINIIPQS